jgi:DNA polymerase
LPKVAAKTTLADFRSLGQNEPAIDLSPDLSAEKNLAPPDASRREPAPRTPAPQSLLPESERPPPLPLAERIAALEVIRREVAACTRCADLVRSRTQTVFGVGNIQPRLCFFGEAPGADEDSQGEPFVGRAGQLLNKIIAACKIKREDVYILNAIKCRPENNRTPNESEINNCWEYARRQLEILRPEFICCLGGVAVRSLLKRQESIGKLRQKFFDYAGSRVMVTYHPAFLLRDPSAKRYVWDDMQMLMKAMGIQL